MTQWVDWSEPRWRKFVMFNCQGRELAVITKSTGRAAKHWWGWITNDSHKYGPFNSRVQARRWAEKAASR